MKDDFFASIRSTMIAKMQVSLKSIRKEMSMSAKQLGEVLGLTELDINRLEQDQISMTELQYVALCGLLDNQMRDDIKLRTNVLHILDVEDGEEVTLLGRWLMVFDEEEEPKEESIEEGQEIDEAAMKLLAEGYKVFLNYDSLKLCKDNDKFFQFLKVMKQCHNTFIVPMRAVDKLQNDMLSFRTSREAKRALSLLNRMKDNNDIVLKGDENDGTVEEVIRTVFRAFKSHYPLALLTEDKELAKELQRMNNKLEGFDIRVITLKNQGMKVYDALSREELGFEAASLKNQEDLTKTIPSLASGALGADLQEKDFHSIPKLKDKQDEWNAISVPKNEDELNAIPMPEDEDELNEVPVPEDEDELNEVPVPEDEDEWNEVSVPGDEDEWNEVPVPEDEDEWDEAPVPEDELNVIPMSEDERNPISLVDETDYDKLPPILNSKENEATLGHINLRKPVAAKAKEDVSQEMMKMDCSIEQLAEKIDINKLDLNVLNIDDMNADEEDAATEPFEDSEEDDAPFGWSKV